MINIINGSLHDPQENITWVENKSSATITLNTHYWKIGEVLIVGYKNKKGENDIMMGIGVKEGLGPTSYRLMFDRSVFVVAEVLEEIPDISHYAFDLRYVVRNEEGDLYFSYRYQDKTTGEVRLEMTKIENPCIIMDTSTGGVWYCNPPGISNIFDLVSKPVINGVVDLGEGNIGLELKSPDNTTYDDLQFVNQEEKNNISKLVFENNFDLQVTSQKYDSQGVTTSSDDPCVVDRTVYTLTSKYSGNPVDLDEIPEGWEKTGTGVYTKTMMGNISSSSGQVEGKLTMSGYTGTKINEGASEEIKKYIFILHSSNLPNDITKTSQKFLTSTSELGLLHISPPQNTYTWFAFPESMKPTGITQIGVTYVSPEIREFSDVTMSGINIGNYVVYRSLNQGNSLTQDIIIK